jgi:hypothetical protein
MLMLQKCTPRACARCACSPRRSRTRSSSLGGHGSGRGRRARRLNDLLLPLVKGYCSEKVYELLAVSLQCFGGSGYCQDYPIEQYIRDQKIDTLYEGTTHIQALDLFFRKVARDGGETLRAARARPGDPRRGSTPSRPARVEDAALERALADVRASSRRCSASSASRSTTSACRATASCSPPPRS